MRVVLDTNVVASALLWGGTPERLVEAAGEGALELFTTEALLAELAGILGRAKFAAKLRLKSLSAAEIVARYREIAETIDAAPLEETTLRDPDDAHVLACALTARAEAIVSGDGDLRALGSYQGIPVLSPADCLDIEYPPPERMFVTVHMARARNGRVAGIEPAANGYRAASPADGRGICMQPANSPRATEEYAGDFTMHKPESPGRCAATPFIKGVRTPDESLVRKCPGSSA